MLQFPQSHLQPCNRLFEETYPPSLPPFLLFLHSLEILLNLTVGPSFLPPLLCFRNNNCGNVYPSETPWLPGCEFLLLFNHSSSPCPSLSSVSSPVTENNFYHKLLAGTQVSESHYPSCPSLGSLNSPLHPGNNLNRGAAPPTSTPFSGGYNSPFRPG